ncbi:glutathione transport system permease protein GsiC [bacterium BMS3Abin05]|nr:glutathione transport system permease protein GsiC [bacterium BMS3Abin05]GBE26840.1 glutathione transport system permease protein GsiC [bacterium BMS3Bbin03]HDK36089.1 ABC transporter permease [Bacteroidota bacterium]HDL78018.1 ABC transporter permease [Bacteroidota bacterium]HDZ10868.1 ABC transporter permease [Bacteroidota bacterium]
MLIQIVYKRLVHSVLLVFAVITFTFLIIHLVPGSPTDYLVDPRLSPETIKTIQKNLGLDQPVYIQYWRWINNILKGDFGYSFSQQRSVFSILKEAIPATLMLTVSAFILELLLGIFFGVFAAIHYHHKSGHLINLMALLFFGIPEFWLGLMAIFLFAIKFHWFPTGQMTTPGQGEVSFFYAFADLVRHLFLPVLVLALSSAAYTTRFVRGNMLGVLQKDFIAQARLLGVRPKRVYYKLALKNTLLPVVTLIGLGFPFLLGGSLVIEYLFSWPGMGWLTFHAVLSRDYPIILASTTITAIMVIFGNLISDLLYPIVDPRTRYSGKREA